MELKVVWWQDEQKETTEKMYSSSEPVYCMLSTIVEVVKNFLVIRILKLT